MKEGMVQFVRKDYSFEMDDAGQPIGIKVHDDITESQG